MLQTIHIIVRGKVQGVFFRYHTKEKAQELGISGTVRNTMEGNVEIFATGNEEQLDEFSKWCQQGPPKAKVSTITLEKSSLQNFPAFEIIR